MPEGLQNPRSRFGAKMNISQPNCSFQKASKDPGPDIEPKCAFHSQIVIARRIQKAQVQIWNQKKPFHSQVVIAERLGKAQV